MVSAVEIDTGTLTLEDLGHDQDNDRVCHLGPHDDRNIAYCGYVVKNPRPFHGYNNCEHGICVVCREMARSIL